MIKVTPNYLYMMMVIVLLMGCNQQEEQPQLESGAKSTISATTTPVDSPFVALDELPTDGIRLPANDNLPGGLLLAVQDAENQDSLYFARFDGQPAYLLSDRIVSFRAALSPYGPLVAYPAHDGRRWHFVLTDLTTLETVQIVEVGRAGDVNGWSPDGQWLSLHTTDLGLIVFNIVTETSTQVFDQYNVSAWLDDNTLIYLMPNADGVNISLMRYLPEQERHEMLLEKIPATYPRDLIDLETFLHERNLRFAKGFNQYGRTVIAPDGQSRYVINWPDAVWNNDVIVCEHWRITQNELQSDTTSVVYDVEDSHFLADLTLLPGGDLVFLKWEVSDCSFGNDMQISLLRVEPSGNAFTITEDVYTGTNRADRDHRYTISPDGDFVFWIGRGESTETILNATELSSGITTTILSVSGMSPTIFKSILYVPAQVK